MGKSFFRKAADFFKDILGKDDLKERERSDARANLAGTTPGYWISDHYKETQHFTGWNYVAVSTIAKQFAQATVTVFQDGDKEKLKLKGYTPDAPTHRETPRHNHHIAKLLAKPNPKTSGEQFFYQIGCQFRLTGGCYIWEVSNRFGWPVELWVIPRAWVRQMLPPSPQYPFGAYWVTPAINSVSQAFTSPYTTGYMLDARLVISMGWPNPLYPGEYTSPLAACSMQIDISEQQDRATFSGFENSVKPGLFFKADPSLDLTQDMLDRARSQIDSYKAGTSNVGKTLMLQGVDVQNLGGSPAELDYVNGRNQSRDTILAIQGVSPMAAGVTETTSYAAGVASLKQTTELSVQPDLQLIGGAFTNRWKEKFGDSFRVQLDAKNFDDPVLNLQYIQAKIASGCYTKDEIRAEWGDLPLPADKGGDEFAGSAGGGGEDPNAMGMDGAEDGEMGGGEMEGLDTDQMADEPSDSKMTGIKRPDLTNESGNTLRGF